MIALWNAFVGDLTDSTTYQPVSVIADGISDAYSIGGNIEGDFGLAVVQTDAAGAVAFANAAVRMRKGATGSFNLDTTDQAGAALDIQVDQNSDGSTDRQTTRTDNLSNDITARMTSDEASDDDVDQTP